MNTEENTDLMSTQLCLCGHQNWEHDKETGGECNPKNNRCECKGFDDERQYWADNEGGSFTYSLTIMFTEKKLARKIKKVGSYLKQREKRRASREGREIRAITTSDIFLYTLERYSGPMEEQEWMT